MGKKRAQYSIEFKAKITLAAIHGEETALQLAARYHIHPTQINSWKRHLIENSQKRYHCIVRGSYKYIDSVRFINQQDLIRLFNSPDGATLIQATTPV